MSTEAACSFFIETLGCQMNVYDSDLLRRRFVSEGYGPAPSADAADVVLLNTCSIRRRAEARAWNRLAEYARLKGENGRPLIVLCGCVASRTLKGLGEGEASRADVIAGCGTYDDLISVVETELGRSGKRPGPIRLPDSPTAVYARPALPERTPLKAFVSISRGCDSECAYCVVPSARGPHRSRPLAEVVEEIEALAARGTREVTLLGQNVNVYRHEGADFCTVLGAADEIPDIWRIRFTSPHPRDMNRDVLVAIARAEKVCEHLHLPLQSGSDAVLRAMRRGYTTAEYRGVIEEARARVAGIAVSTDLMVGFPGETDACFEESLDFIREVSFDAAYTFKYSERPGTVASRMRDPVPEETKATRLERLLEVQNRVTDALNQRLVGQRVEILVEGPDQRDPESLSGRTRTNKIVSFLGDPSLAGTLVTVRVESAGRWSARGSIVDGRRTGGGHRP